MLTDLERRKLEELLYWLAEPYHTALQKLLEEEYDGEAIPKQTSFPNIPRIEAEGRGESVPDLRKANS